MRIVLVDVDIGRWQSGIYLKNSVLEPYAIECLGAVLKKEGVDVVLLQFDKGSAKSMAKTILTHKPHIVGFSVLTSNFNINKQIACEIKKNSSDILTIFGGYYPSLVPDIVKNREIDVVVIGEGEKVIVNIVKAVAQGKSINNVNGIAYWENGVKITPPQSRIDDLDALPWPMRNIEWMQKSKVAQPIYPTQKEQKSVAQITYSRGCKYSCAFCCSHILWKKQSVWRSPQEVVKEIKYLIDTYDVNLFFFTDLSFNSQPIKVYELCEELLKQKIETSWTVDCRFLPNPSEELFKNMRKAGCTRIAWGLESVTDMTLSKINKRQNIKIVSKNLHISNKVGILNRVFLMIGYPWETQKDLRQIPKILKTLPIDSIRIAFLTPFPGTILWKQFKQSLLTNDLDHFTTDEPVLQTKDMSKDDLINIRQLIFKEFYNSIDYERHWKNKIKQFPHLKKSFEEFFEFLYKYELCS